MDEVKLTNQEKYYIMSWLFVAATCLLVLSIIVDVWKLPNKIYTIVSIFFMFIGFWYGAKFGSRSIKEENGGEHDGVIRHR